MQQIWNIFMHNKNQSPYCRVCGLDQEELPWGKDGKSPSFAICDCCGVEFGYQDCNKKYVSKFRNIWLSSGCNWFGPKKKPVNWSLEEQLKNIPKEFK